jgi:hypothetical protein
MITDSIRATEWPRVVTFTVVVGIIGDAPFGNVHGEVRVVKAV